MLRGKAKEILTKFKSVNPQDLKLLQSKHIEGRKSGKENLFQSILRYDSNWYEKRVLFNPEIAEDITDKILKVFSNSCQISYIFLILQTFSHFFLRIVLQKLIQAAIRIYS